MKKTKRTPEGHIHDTDRAHKERSYQTTRDRQNLRQTSTTNTHNFKREDLGFTNRDTRGYDKQHKGKY